MFYFCLCCFSIVPLLSFWCQQPCCALGSPMLCRWCVVRRQLLRSRCWKQKPLRSGKYVSDDRLIALPSIAVPATPALMRCSLVCDCEAARIRHKQRTNMIATCCAFCDEYSVRLGTQLSGEVNIHCLRFILWQQRHCSSFRRISFTVQSCRRSSDVAHSLDLWMPLIAAQKICSLSPPPSAAYAVVHVSVDAWQSPCCPDWNILQGAVPSRSHVQDL